jgi:cell shape-determining protein MreD
MNYAEFKLLLGDWLGLEKDALHIHAAILLYILAMFAFRQTRRSRFPWLFVLAVELANETYDLIHQDMLGEELRYHDSIKDLWNTMLWPTVLLLIGRYTSLFQHRTRCPPAEQPR